MDSRNSWTSRARPARGRSARHLRPLRRLADDTGGRFYTAKNVDGLAEDVRFIASGKTVIEACELWDMPILFLLAVSLLGLEWGLRKRAGMA